MKRSKKRKNVEIEVITEVEEEERHEDDRSQQEISRKDKEDRCGN